MQVVGIEQVDVRGSARAFTGRAERELAQAADFLQAPRDLLGARVLDQEVSARDQALLGRQRFDLRLEERLRYRRYYRFLFSPRRALAGCSPLIDSSEHAPQALLDSPREARKGLHRKRAARREH